jgi:peptidoglycan/LPS O-acetylase OafA/YrhL
MKFSDLRRTTNAKAFIPEIDGLRFIAIITVVIYHLNTAYSKQLGMLKPSIAFPSEASKVITSMGWWITRMDLGVKLFFAISGFVLAIPFLRHYVQGGKKIELKDYFLRRLTRLEPPYLISLIIFAVIHLVMFGMPLPQLIQSFLASLIYSHVFIFAMPNPINPVTWSLETEAQFYLLVPLFFMLLFRHKSSVYRFIFIASIFAFSLFFRWYSYSLELFHWSRSILAFFTHFITGILFAWLYLTKKEFFVQKSYLWDLIGIISLIGIFQFYKPQAYWVNKSLFNLSTFIFMASAFKGILLNWFFTRPAIYVTGGMCYSIYLLHYAFLHLLVKFTGNISTGMGYQPDLLLQLIIAIPAIFIVSSIFYLLFEKPCMDKNWPSRLMGRLRLKMSPLPR